MEECESCTHFGLFKMVTGGQPYQFCGDIPCLRCCNLTKEHSEFAPAGKEITRQVWDNLPDVAK